MNTNQTHPLQIEVKGSTCSLFEADCGECVLYPPDTLATAWYSGTIPTWLTVHVSSLRLSTLSKVSTMNTV
jgi:hypothetical protein